MFNMHVTVIVKRLLNYTKNEFSENDTPGDFILVESCEKVYPMIQEIIKPPLIELF